MAGLFKKVVIANTLASNLVDPVFGNPEMYGTLDTLVAIYGYALQIYCDFSAYSDIAIGTALLLGFHFPINFNAPYFSTSIQDFWRRWHISLSTWLRDYLYIPLGGSRGSSMRTYTNLLITFLLGGLWHGAGWNFIIWGALHGLYLSIERLGRQLFGNIRKPWSIPTALSSLLKRIICIHLVCFSWIFFRAPTFEDASLTLQALFRWQPPEYITWTVAFALLISFCTQFLDGNRIHRFWTTFARLPVWLQALAAAFVITLIFSLGPKGVAPFIYFQF